MAGKGQAQPAAAGAQIGFDAVDTVEQPIPALVGGTDRRPLGHEPAREPSAPSGEPFAGGDLDPHEAMKQVLPFPGPESEGPGLDRGEAPGFGRIDRRAMAGREPQVAIEVLARRTGGSRGSSRRHHARVRGPAGAIGQRAVDQEPAVGTGAVTLAKRDLERAARPVERSGRIRQIANRMRRIVGGKGDRLEAVGHRLPRPGRPGGPGSAADALPAE